MAGWVQDRSPLRPAAQEAATARIAGSTSSAQSQGGSSPVGSQRARSGATLASPVVVRLMPGRSASSASTLANQSFAESAAGPPPALARAGGLDSGGGGLFLSSSSSNSPSLAVTIRSPVTDVLPSPVTFSSVTGGAFSVTCRRWMSRKFAVLMFHSGVTPTADKSANMRLRSSRSRCLRSASLRPCLRPCQASRAISASTL